MPRGKTKQLDRPIKVNVMIRESVLSRLKLALFSELEGCVPYGEVSKLVNSLLTVWLDGKVLDLTPFGLTGSVHGSPTVIQNLETLLQQLQQKEKE